MKFIFTNHRLLFLFFVFISTGALAQKLTNIQQGPLTIPAGYKIDGKDTEWDGRYINYNKAVNLYYNIAHDKNNLYLIVKATDRRIIQKIIYVGVTLVVNRAGNKKEDFNEAVLIQYPKLSPQEGAAIIWASGARADLESTKVAHMPDTVKKQLTRYQEDSLRAVANTKITANAKLIKVKGIEAITDTLLSVYNTERIKVAAAFNTGGNYIYELSIPLDLLKIDANQTSFTYSIKLNSRYVEPQKGMLMRFYYPTRDSGPVNRDPDFDSTTYLWGNYDLALPVK